MLSDRSQNQKLKVTSKPRLKLKIIHPQIKQNIEIKTTRKKPNNCTRIQIGIEQLRHLLKDECMSYQTKQQRLSCDTRRSIDQDNAPTEMAIINTSMPIHNHNIEARSISQTVQNKQQCSKWCIDDFEILKIMGKGKFGTVMAAKQKKTDYYIALKKMNKKQLRAHNFEMRIQQQINIQMSLKHANILKLYGYFWDTESVYLILEYVHGGQLLNYINRSRICEPNISCIIRQVCYGVSYLHCNSIIHRDIKPENILVGPGKIKIADFGWSVQSAGRRQTLCGTLDYLAPEIVSGSTHDHSLDIWQIGILTYELAVGHPPFQTSSHDQTYRKILKAEILFPSFVSAQLRQFIRFILQKDGAKRPKITEIISHSFIQKHKHLTHTLI